MRINEQIQLERSNVSFNVEQMKIFLYGGERLLEQKRKFGEKIQIFSSN